MSKPKTNWDLSPLLSGDNDPKAAQYRQNVTKATKAFAKKWRARDDYLKDPTVLREALDELEAWERLPGNGNEDYYFHLRSNLDSIDPKIKAKAGKIDEFSRDIANELQFFWLKVAKIKPSLQRKFINHSELAPYKHLVERVFASAKYRLTEPEEKIMMLKSSVSHGRWVKMVTDLLSREEAEVFTESGKKKTQTFEQLVTLLSSKDKKVRDVAAKAFNKILEKQLDIAEVEFNVVLEDKQINDKLRGYQRPDDARHLVDDIETKTVDALLEAVHSYNHVSKDFYVLKSKLLGLPKLQYHERNVEYGSINKKYSFEDATAIVRQVFNGIDSEFGDIFQQFLSNGQIDVFPKKGKRGGAFCAGHHSLTAPTYILLNYTEQLRDVTTLAHELGHGINNQLIKQKQNGLNCTTPMSTAEVASTFMQDFVAAQLVAEANDELRLSLMMSQLNDIVSAVFRQIGLYRFEREVHLKFRERGYLSKEEIGALFTKHSKEYMGSVVEQSPGSQNWWLYVWHFRTYFYVYSYASGLLISKALQAKVRQDPSFVKEVKTFLAAGTSKSPKDIFAEMGIKIDDPAFWKQGLEEIAKLLQDTRALARKLGKIK